MGTEGMKLSLSVKAGTGREGMEKGGALIKERSVEGHRTQTASFIIPSAGVAVSIK